MYKGLLVLFSTVFLQGCAMKMSPYHRQKITETFFSEPTIMVDTPKEKKVLLQALRDTQELPTQRLQHRLYQDPHQTHLKHGVLTIFHMYLIPSYPVLLNEDVFFTDVKRKEIQKLIQQTEDRVQDRQSSETSKKGL